jgi:DNA adenine methylase
MSHPASRLAPRRGDHTRSRPFLKWVGGKWAVAPQIARLLPHHTRKRVYREPFLGGGGVFFYLHPERAFLSDALAELVVTYQLVQKRVAEVIDRLVALRASHSADQFYAVRRLFNQARDAPAVDRAAWFIYLNKTCFNGLYRTNRAGSFNVPLGRYAASAVVDPPALRRASAALANAVVARAPFDQVLVEAQPGDVIYFDPPYAPLSETSSFSAYTTERFSLEDHERLAAVFRELDERGCLLALSNRDTPEVRRLYRGYDVARVLTLRTVGRTLASRGQVADLLVRNLTRYPRRTFGGD